MARKWFAKFKNGNFDIDNTPCSKRPSEFDKDHLKALLKEESCQKNKLQSKNDSPSSSFNGICQKIGVWLPHELSENNKENRLQFASQHLICLEQHVVTNSTLCTELSWEMRNGAYI